MVELISTMSVITFDVNGLNIPVKRDDQNGLRYMYSLTFWIGLRIVRHFVGF